MKSFKSVMFLLFFAMCGLAVLFTGCSGGGTTSSTNSGTVTSTTNSTTNAYVGTQTAGDFWTWGIANNSGSLTFTASDTATGVAYNGTAAPLAGNSAGFTNFTITSSTIANAVGEEAYAVEVPGTLLLATPGPFETLYDQSTPFYGSSSAPIFAIAQGSCPTTGGLFNWVMVPSSTWCSGDDPNGTCPNGTSVGPAYGLANITVSGSSYSMTTHSYLLNGTAAGSISMSGATCSGGVISGTDSDGDHLNISFTPTGTFFIDLPSGKGSIVGAQAAAVDINSAFPNGTASVGWAFSSMRTIGNNTASPWTIPISGVSNGSGMGGGTSCQFSDMDSGAQDCSVGQGWIVFNSQPSPGLWLASNYNGGGQQVHDQAFVVTQIGGKYYLFSITDNWNNSRGNGTGEMSGANYFIIQTN
jgi:hypothetical protein